jgi:hypothetical protein
MTILLAIMIMSGIQPGPAMLTTNLPLTISLVYTLVLACTIVVPIVLAFAPLIVRTAAVPPNILAPIVLAFVTLSAYMGEYSIFDLVVVVAFGVLGVFMKRYGWPRPPILIATVLASIVERYLWLSVNTYGWEMLTRIPSIIIFLVMVAIMWMSLRVQVGARKAMREAAAAGAATGEAAPAVERLVEGRRGRLLSLESGGELVLLILVAAFFGYLLYGSMSWKLGASIIPWTAVALGTPFLILRFIAVLRPARGGAALAASPGQIMDIGFGASSDGAAPARFLRIVVYILAMYLGIWLLGFHVALPLATFIYLYVYGRAGLLWSAAVALMFLALIMGVYDELLHARWHDAPILIWLGLD